MSLIDTRSEIIFRLLYTVILVPIAYTLVRLSERQVLLHFTQQLPQGVKYNIENEAIIGALFIPLGVGNFST